MATTDHAMEYRNFEGVLAEGHYGAGPVMIWDEGTYVPEIEVAKGVRESITDKEQGEKVMQEGLAKGEIKFELFGKKLQGSFALVKTRGFGPKNAWLLIKHKDKHTKEGYNANDYDISAHSGKTLKEIAELG